MMVMKHARHEAVAAIRVQGFPLAPPVLVQEIEHVYETCQTYFDRNGINY
jgi:hypothetical protein